MIRSEGRARTLNSPSLNLSLYPRLITNSSAAALSGRQQLKNAFWSFDVIRTDKWTSWRQRWETLTLFVS